MEIYVDDMDRVPLVKAQEMEGMPDMQMAFFPWVENAPNANGALVKMNGVSPGTGGTLVYFQCDDCAVEESRTEAAGGKVEQPKMSIGEYGFCSVCIDTEENRFGLLP